VFRLVNYLADTSDALCLRARTLMLVRECVCVSMWQFVGLLDLNIGAAYSWLMSLTFFLSASQNNALYVYLQYATVYCQSLSQVCFVRSVPVPVL